MCTMSELALICDLAKINIDRDKLDDYFTNTNKKQRKIWHTMFLTVIAALKGINCHFGKSGHMQMVSKEKSHLVCFS